MKDFTGREFTYKVVCENTDVIEVFKQAKRCGKIGFDTESNGKDWWNWNDKPEEQIAGLSISIPQGENYYIPLRMRKFHPEDRNANFALVGQLLQSLITYQVLLVGGNLKHDWHVIYRAFSGIDLSKTKAKDILLDSHIFRVNRLHSVKALGLEYVSPEADFYEKLLVIWKKEAGYTSNFYDYRQFPTELMGPYGACDTWLTLGIDEYHQRNNFESLFGEYAKHEHGMARRLFHAEERGIKVDIPYFEELKEDYEKQIFLEESAVKVWAGKSDLNLNSQPQLKKVLYDELKLPVQKSWDKDKQDWKITTDKTALLMLQGKHPIVDHLQKHRKLTKLYGTYILGILNNYNPHTYRIHTTFNQFVENSSALRTGRLSSSDPINFENIPRNDTAIRRGFLPDTEFVFCDYAGQEIRLYTLYSREPTLIKAFANGEDVHSRTCAAVFLLDYDYIVKNRKTDKDIELKREIAKRIFFGALYGAGYKRVANILAEFGYGYDEKEGKRLLANLYSNYPNFPRYMANVDKRIKERGFVTDIFKRQYIPKNAGVNYPVGNYLIQGTAGGMLKQVSNTIGDVFGDDIFSNWIHDEIAFDRLPNRKAIIEIKEIMEHWPMIDIPMVVDVSWTNQSWREKAEIKAENLTEWSQMQLAA